MKVYVCPSYQLFSEGKKGSQPLSKKYIFAWFILYDLSAALTLLESSEHQTSKITKRNLFGLFLPVEELHQKEIHNLAIFSYLCLRYHNFFIIIFHALILTSSSKR